MTSISIIVPMSPISLNHSHQTMARNGRVFRFKKASTKQYEDEFNYYIQSGNEQRDIFFEKYNPEIFSIKIESFFYINESKYFAKPKNKKSGKTISKRSMDVDNISKIANDLIFKWIGIDDSQITCSICEKIPTNDEGSMVFRISLVRFPELFLVSPESI